MFAPRTSVVPSLADSLVETDISPQPPSRTLGGLGRGLAGILDRSQDHAPPAASGLSQLLGQRATTPPRVRQFVADTALEAIIEAFGAEAVVLVRRDDGPGPHVVASRVPPSWGDGSSLTFELFGHLWTLLDEVEGPGGPPAGDGSETAGWRVIEIGPYHTWLGSQQIDGGRLAAAVVCSRPPGAQERSSMLQVVRSVAHAVGAERSSLPPGCELWIDTDRPAPEHHRAEVVIDWADGSLTPPGIGEGSTRELAIARAAVDMQGSAAEVEFAGCTDLDGVTVSIVVLADAAPTGDRRPLLGLAVTDQDTTGGPAQAVLAALGFE